VSALTPITRFARSDPTATAAGLLTKLDAGPFLVKLLRARLGREAAASST